MKGIIFFGELLIRRSNLCWGDSPLIFIRNRLARCSLKSLKKLIKALSEINVPIRKLIESDIIEHRNTRGTILGPKIIMTPSPISAPGTKGIAINMVNATIDITMARRTEASLAGVISKSIS